jgi:hypothetical protein
MDEEAAEEVWKDIRDRPGVEDSAKALPEVKAYKGDRRVSC